MIRKTQFGDYEKTITIPVFAKYRIQIVFAEELKGAWKARYNSKVKIGDDCRAFHQSWNDGTSRLFFTIDDCTTGTVAHECFHAVWALMDFVGIGFKEEELITYLLDYVVQAVQDFKNTLGIKSRKKKKR